MNRNVVRIAVGSGRRWPRVSVLACLAALVAYGIFIAWQYPPVAAGADSGGYFFSARLMQNGELSAPLRRVAEMPDATWRGLQPLGAIGADDSERLKPAYPPGLPAHFALAGAVLGLEWGATLVAALAACAGVALTFALLRRLEVSPVLSVTGAAALALSPQFVFSSISPMSDAVATAWVMLAAYAALRMGSAWPWGIICGAAIGVAVAVRPSNAVIVPALCVLGANWRGLAAAAVAGAPFAAALAWYQHVQYGSAIGTGYGDVGSLFTRTHLGPNLVHYAEWVPKLLPIGCLALLVIWQPWRRLGRVVAGLWLWVVAVFGFYALYQHTHDAWWFLRFVLPAFPALVVLAMLAVDRFVGDRRLRIRGVAVDARVLIAIVAVVVSALDFVQVARTRYILLTKAYHEPYRSIAAWANENLPDDAVVLAMQTSMTLYHYTGFPVVRWDVVTPEHFTQLREGVRASGRPLYAILFRFEAEDDRWRERPAVWRKIAEVNEVGVWKFDGEAPLASSAPPAF